MVVRHSTALPDHLHANATLTGELRNYKKSFLLDPISVEDLEPSIFLILLFPLYTCLLLLLTSLLSTIPHVQIVPVPYLLGIYLAIQAYLLVSSLIYRWYLTKTSSIVSYMHVLCYTLSYMPLSMLLRVLLKALGFIFVFAYVLVVQYYSSAIVTLGHEWTSRKNVFVFSLITLVISFMFVYGVEAIYTMGIAESASTKF
ncbi:putative transporter [Trachipleistophora hominis]|uniref:Putative transporter n=1 Tax=Trachipleistophora hominis TaxID=72359 RepID=L7JS17_TRAHO|nr:putative transporter [Trachipleistophora hominis]